MDNRLIDFTDQLRASKDVLALWATSVNFFFALGFSIVNYGLIEKATSELLGYYTTMDDSWMAHYIASQFQLTDPWVNHAKADVKPALFSRDEINELPMRGDENEARLMRDSIEVGLNRTLLIPFHNDLFPKIAGINLVTDTRHDDFMNLVDKDRGVILVAAALVNSHLTGLPVVQSPSGPWVPLQDETALLTQREIEVLKWLSEGYQNNRIAEKMNLAPVTVNFHLGSIKKKLGAKTREQALIIAIRKGFVGL